MKNKRNVFKWVADHISPFVKYDKKSGDELCKDDSIKEKFEKTKEKLTFGIKFRIKF